MRVGSLAEWLTLAAQVATMAGVILICYQIFQTDNASDNARLDATFSFIERFNSDLFQDRQNSLNDRIHESKKEWRRVTQLSTTDIDGSIIAQAAMAFDPVESYFQQATVCINRGLCDGEVLIDFISPFASRFGQFLFFSNDVSPGTQKGEYSSDMPGFVMLNDDAFDTMIPFSQQCVQYKTESAKVRSRFHEHLEKLGFSRDAYGE